MERFNLLITSINKKVPLIKAVRSASSRFGIINQIIGADSDANCIGRYFVDDFWEMPPIVGLSIDDLIKYCHTNQIAYIIPTRDGELLFFANHKQTLREQGIMVMISDPQVINICFDKLLFYGHSSPFGFPVIETSLDINGMTCETYVVKERFGAGSHSIGLNLNHEQAVNHRKYLTNPVFQPFIPGKEYSVDLYVNSRGKTHGIITRIRELIVNGESQITTTEQNPKLERICANFAETLGLYGHIVFQVLIDSNNKLHIIECNSRFGGASTLSIAMGLDSFFWFLLESNGIDLDSYPFRRSPIEKTQIRYAEDLII